MENGEGRERGRERGEREREREERKMVGKLDVRRLEFANSPMDKGGRGVVVVADGGANTFLSPSLGTSLDA